MFFFIIVFIIIFLLIKILDFNFYLSLYKILEFKKLDPKSSLESLGYYNKSIFTSSFYPFFISLLITILIYSIYFFLEKKRQGRKKKKIEDLEEYLIQINKGNYSINLNQEDDEYSNLRDQIYKIIVNLKSLEEESTRQRLNLKRDLSNIAHQLKTPITSIGFMAELIKEDKENTDIYLGKLYEELEKLKNFTEVLLKLSKINSNTIEYKYVDLSILEILKDIEYALNRKKKIPIDYKGEDFVLKGDEVWLYEAFLNIFKNSLEHTNSRVWISLDSNPIYKTVRISDDGPGVEEKSLDRIFDRFYRGDTSLAGYGIGLNMAKSIIEAHGGDIRAYNNQGLTFEIKFYNI